jgi:hypothetical protein
MAWEVEFTDELGLWWDGLIADEQDSVNFAVRLLQESGPGLKRPTPIRWRVQPTRTCVSYAANTKAGLTECFMRLTHDALAYC